MHTALAIPLILASLEVGNVEAVVEYPENTIVCTTESAADAIVREWDTSGPLEATVEYRRMTSENTCRASTAIKVIPDKYLWRGVLMTGTGQQANVSIIEARETGPFPSVLYVITIYALSQ